MRISTFVLCLLGLLVSCGNDDDGNEPSDNPASRVLANFYENYTTLPELLVASDTDSLILAQYINPTDKYAHGVMGDAIEAEGLVVYFNEQYLELQLGEDYVYEDLKPRLVDVTQDEIPEVICIRTHIDRGAGLVIYQIAEDTLIEYAHVAEIGQRNRWLNTAAIADLDDDGIRELAWVQTPHIGGILKVAEITTGEITPVAELVGPSNHGLQERNLCLSALVERGGGLQMVLPAQARDAVFFYTYNANGELSQVGDSSMNVQFDQLLYDQLDAYTFIRDGNCL